jgi:hypothetical protein
MGRYMKLDYSKHYVNKKKTKHYYVGKIFSNEEWKSFKSGERVQETIISINSPYRSIPKTCERWYNQPGDKLHVVHCCPNPPFYRSDVNGIFFCKSCARIVAKINPPLSSFSRIKEK